MLAFDDDALARIMIAAGSIPRRSRGQWLRRFAREVGADHRRKGDAVRHQRARARERDGVKVYRLPLSDEAVEALLASGRLDERQALDHQQCERALADVVHEWAARWVR